VCDQIVAIIALIVSIVSLGLSVYFWRRQFRPIITATVKTAAAGNISIAFSLQIKNSGSLPAKNIKLLANQSDLQNAFGNDATEENKNRWLAAFNEENVIPILQNGESITCSFGMSQPNDSGFWKYRANLLITIEYFGWFGNHYVDTQNLKFIDSESFTGFLWGSRS
jgi:hypothetical protein